MDMLKFAVFISTLTHSTGRKFDRHELESLKYDLDELLGTNDRVYDMRCFVECLGDIENNHYTARQLYAALSGECLGDAENAISAYENQVRNNAKNYVS